MRVAGIRRAGDPVEVIETREPRPLADGEVLLEVMAAGVGNWDEFIRVGGWDVGAVPPMALGVEAAGTVAAVGGAVTDWAVGDAVMTHPVPLRDQGTWAPMLIAPAALLAPKPNGVSWEAAAAFPIPALTAEQVLSDALHVRARRAPAGPRRGRDHRGAAGRSRRLARRRGHRDGGPVKPAAGQRAGGTPRHRLPRPGLARARPGGHRWPRAAAAASAAPGGAASAIRAVADGGRLATITSDPPAEQRGITVDNVYVRSDGRQLRDLATRFGDGQLQIPIAASYHLADAARALAQVNGGHAGGAVVRRPNRAAGLG